MKTTDKDYKFMEDTLLKNPHDVNLPSQTPRTPQEATVERSEET